MINRNCQNRDGKTAVINCCLLLRYVIPTMVSIKMALSGFDFSSNSILQKLAQFASVKLVSGPPIVSEYSTDSGKQKEMRAFTDIFHILK